MIELRYYLNSTNGKRNNDVCKHCLHILRRRTQKILARCPNCGEPYFENWNFRKEIKRYVDYKKNLLVKQSWDIFLQKNIFFFCKNNKITRGGRFELAFVNKFDGTISVAGF